MRIGTRTEGVGDAGQLICPLAGFGSGGVLIGDCHGNNGLSLAVLLVETVSHFHRVSVDVRMMQLRYRNLGNEKWCLGYWRGGPAMVNTGI